MTIQNQANPSTHKPILAKDVMTEKLITLNPKQDVFAAIDTLLQHNISGAPVVDENFRLVGIISQGDCLKALINTMYDKVPLANVANAMTSSVKTVMPTTDILTLANLFMNHGFRRLPVVENEQLIGQVSRRDLLRVIAQMMRETPQQDSSGGSLYLSAIDNAAKANVVQ